MDYDPVLGHRDMGMGMAGMHGMHDMSSMNAMTPKNTMKAMDHSAHDMSAMTNPSMNKDHSTHNMKGMNMPATDKPAPAGMGSQRDIAHEKTEFGPHVDMRAATPMNGLDDPGIGLRDHAQRYGRRVLRYADLRNLYKTEDRRDPSREIQLHLTGNMQRYMWSMDGIPFADAAPLQFKYGERLRIVLVNDSMMTHPIHMHGVWSELETGEAMYLPKKHTILVQPGSKISYLVSADAVGRWAYHCHLLYHMPGMMREVHITEGGVQS
jgi:FtsP/CotA-like multicopper oxidase with cupredoxin domain